MAPVAHLPLTNVAEVVIFCMIQSLDPLGFKILSNPPAQLKHLVGKHRRRALLLLIGVWMDVMSVNLSPFSSEGINANHVLKSHKNVNLAEQFS